MTLAIEMRELHIDDEKQVSEIHRLMQLEDNFDFLLSDYQLGENFEVYLERVTSYKDWATVPEGKVPSTFLVAVINGEIAGRLSIRHDLNEYLARIGGHIGYGTAPQFRGMGVSSHMLGYGLTFLEKIGVERCFISCRDGNLASQRIIEKSGGEFAGLVSDIDAEATLFRTYWIATTR